MFEHMTYQMKEMLRELRRIENERRRARRIRWAISVLILIAIFAALSI